MSDTPFDLPSIVLKKAVLQDVLLILRERLNKSYMPSATGDVQYNSKPHYYSKNWYGFDENRADCLTDYPTFPNPIFFVSTFELASWDVSSGGPRVMFALLNDERVEILINLITCDTLVRSIGNGINGGPWMRWLDVPDQEIALDISLIKKMVDERL